MTFSSSSSISNAPGFGPTPLVECARHVAARSWTISLRSRLSIASTERFQ
jgi:hypothetical protein